jgi:hypothetical protein
MTTTGGMTQDTNDTNSKSNGRGMTDNDEDRKTTKWTMRGRQWQGQGHPPHTYEARRVVWGRGIRGTTGTTGRPQQGDDDTTRNNNNNNQARGEDDAHTHPAS